MCSCAFFFFKLLLRHWYITLTKYGVEQQRGFSVQVFILNPSNAHQSGNQNKLKYSKCNKFRQYFLWNKTATYWKKTIHEHGLIYRQQTITVWINNDIWWVVCGLGVCVWMFAYLYGRQWSVSVQWSRSGRLVAVWVRSLTCERRKEGRKEKKKCVFLKKKENVVPFHFKYMCEAEYYKNSWIQCNTNIISDLNAKMYNWIKTSVTASKIRTIIGVIKPDFMAEQLFSIALGYQCVW